MHLYKLENTRTDQDFLSGKTVLCQAVIPIEDLAIFANRDNLEIVVQLSSKSKYKGVVKNFKYIVKDNYAVGLLEIIKAGHNK